MKRAASDDQTEHADTPRKMPTGRTLRDLRKRWESARRVVSEAVGAEKDHDPAIWERGVYQLWLWLVIERLVVHRDDIDLDELSKISRMLLDQRKISLQHAKVERASETDQPSEGQGNRLPERFGEIVRQIYGTNLQTNEEPCPDQCGTR